MGGFDFIWQWLAHRPMIDWGVFMNALDVFLRGGNPYAAGDFFNPPWALLLLYPFSLIPPAWQPLAVLIASLSISLALARRFHLRGLRLILLLTSPVLWWLVGWGNIDWLVLSGLLLPSPIGLVLLAIKPQATAPLILVLLLRAYDEGGWRRLGRTILPLGILTAWWLVAYGAHFTTAANGGNASLFPFSLLLGIPILLAALYWRSERLGLLAGPCLSPYVSLSSFLGPALVLPGAAWLYGAFRVFLAYHNNGL